MKFLNEINKSKIHDCRHNLLLTILKGLSNGHLRNYEINYLDSLQCRRSLFWSRTIDNKNVHLHVQEYVCTADWRCEKLSHITAKKKNKTVKPIKFKANLCHF